MKFAEPCQRHRLKLVVNILACVELCHPLFIEDYIVNEIAMCCAVIFKALMKYYFH